MNRRWLFVKMTHGRCRHSSTMLLPNRRHCGAIIGSHNSGLVWCTLCRLLHVVFLRTFAGARCTFYAVTLSNPLWSIVHIACCISYLLFYRIPCVLCVALSHACINSPGVR